MESFYGIEAETAQHAFVIAAGNSLYETMASLLEDHCVDIDGGIGESKSTALTNAAYLSLVGAVKVLIERGANVNLPGGGNKMTPLMLACNNGKSKGSDIAMMLIEAGADVNYVRESDEMTALKFAMKRAKPEVIQALIDKGADIDGPTGSKQTALMTAARYDNVEALEILIENGADPSLQSKLKWAEGYTALNLAKLENCKKAVRFLSSL